AGDMTLTFNTGIDNGCLGGGSTYYYGLDANGPNTSVNFVTVALHEFGHGLGFVSFVNSSTGGQLMNRPDIYSSNLRDNTTGRLWSQMSNAQRRASAVNSGNLAWAGNTVRTQAPNFLQPGPALFISEPASIAGRYQIATALFGPPVSNAAINAEIALASDTEGTNLACTQITNGGEIAGRIALVDRGNCDFTVKVRNAQARGARAVVVVNNQAGSPVPLGGDDPAVNIPAVMISMTDGQRIKNALAEEPDEELPGSLSFASGAVGVAESAGSVTLSVTRTGGTGGAVAASFRTADGTATAGLDYVSTSGNVQFADGEGGTQTVQIPILEDAEAEAPETFTVLLESPTGGASLAGPSTATVTVADNEPCVPSPTVACLTGGRFQVSVTWRDFQNTTGVGSRVNVESEDSALYWFFGPNNWELLVKVLDACGQPTPRFWVFAAATTNVEYELVVTDTQAGITRRYPNPLGVASPAITDTEAFATCP
ncbi:MAG: PA domain-containing protein, partial [Acidobacteriota bacterium]